jgi:hypothetical protein
MFGRFTNRGQGIRAGVYAGVVTARSSDQPGRNHTYTVSIDLPGGSVDFEGVAPDESLRWSTFDETLDLVPFRIGTPVMVLARGVPQNLELTLNTYELPFAGPCTQGGTP